MMSGLQVTSTAMQLLPLVCVSLLTWSGTTFGDGIGPAVINMGVYEDSDVVLPCSLNTTNITQELFDWKKDVKKEVFMYDKGKHYNNGRAGQDEQFKGRVSHFEEQLEFGNASITIRKTKVTDSGRYTCDFPHRHQPKRRANIELVVDPILKDRTPENIPGAASKPVIVRLDETKDWALLRCEVRGASLEPEVEWQDSDGNVLPAEKTIFSDQEGHFDITLQTTVTKTGHYRCVATQKKINHQIHTETLVHLDGAAPEPSVKILDQTNNWALLQCKVRGVFPKPELHWQDSAGNILPAKTPQVTERGGRYDIILNITVDKTDNYHCVSTQKTINHQTDAETRVHISDGAAENQTGSSHGWVVAAVFGVLFFITLLVLLAMCYKSQRRENAGRSVV